MRHVLILAGWRADCPLCREPLIRLAAEVPRIHAGVKRERLLSLDACRSGGRDSYDGSC